MGPGCFHPRNYRWLIQNPAVPSLQWGRDVSIPEIVARRVVLGSVEGLNGAGLLPSQKSGNNQWNHDSGQASMGPGRFHPRNDLVTANTVSTVVLQWGRDVSIPEIGAAANIPADIQTD